MSRHYTNQLLDLINEGVLSSEMVVGACLKWMSEDDVREMMYANGFNIDGDDEEEDDGQPTMYEEYQDLYGGDDSFETCNYVEDF